MGCGCMGMEPECAAYFRGMEPECGYVLGGNIPNTTPQIRHF